MGIEHLKNIFDKRKVFVGGKGGHSGSKLKKADINLLKCFQEGISLLKEKECALLAY